jgi:hypothetical protein
MEQKNLFKEYEDIFGKTEKSEAKDKKEKAFNYSPFALQDAIGEKSAKKAWIEYEKLRFSGIGAEEIIFKILAKVKDMAAIGMGAEKEDLDIKNDYPYNKSKRDLKNWKAGELKHFYAKLVEIYHFSRMRGDDLDHAIEKALLSL